MSIHLPQDLERLKKSCDVLKKVVAELRPTIKVGIKTIEIEQKAHELLKKYGARGSFDQVPGYDYVTCTMVNDQIVHAPPSHRVLKDGDVFTLDIGAYIDGFHSDYADTFVIGEYSDPDVEQFLKVGRDTLVKAIESARIGAHIGDISQTIQQGVEGAGFYIIKQLTGHGIGRTLHEDPLVPGFLRGRVEETPQIAEGLAIAIEVIYAKGTDQIAHIKGDKWTIVTADHSLSAQFEHTVAIIGKKTCILT